MQRSIAFRWFVNLINLPSIYTLCRWKRWKLEFFLHDIWKSNLCLRGNTTSISRTMCVYCEIPCGIRVYSCKYTVWAKRRVFPRYSWRILHIDLLRLQKACCAPGKLLCQFYECSLKNKMLQAGLIHVSFVVAQPPLFDPYAGLIQTANRCQRPSTDVASQALSFVSIRSSVFSAVLWRKLPWGFSLLRQYRILLPSSAADYLRSGAVWVSWTSLSFRKSVLILPLLSGWV